MRRIAFFDTESARSPSPDSIEAKPASSVRALTNIEDCMKDAHNDGKVWRNHPKVQIQERRKPEPRHYDDGGEIDWTSVWIVLIACAVLVNLIV